MNIQFILRCLLSIVLTGALGVYGQICAPNEISTNPEEPNPVLGQGSQTYWTNQFDWQRDMFGINSNNYSQLFFASYPEVPSPFWNNNSSLTYLTNPTTKDFLHEDGWELIKRDMGFMMGGDPDNPAASPGVTGIPVPGPYVVLYNKYRGILRVLMAIGNQNITGYNGVRISLGFDPFTNDFSGLLSYHEAIARPLDQPTRVSTTQSASSFPADQFLFVHADFPVAYDPCTCVFDSKLSITFRLIDDMTVDLDGRIAATSTNIGSIANGTGSIATQDFLSSLSVNGTNVESGVLTYKRTADMVDRYKQIADDREQAKAAAKQAGLFPKFLKTVLGVVDLGLGLASVPAPSFKGIVKDGKFTAEGKEYGKGVKAAGYLSKFISKQVKVPDAADDPIPEMGSVIEGEMRFVGTINDIDTYDASINIDNPGSSATFSASESRYPTYNEILGIFSVLETPEIYYSELWELVGLGGYTATSFRFAGDLKYAFNPVLPINFTKTKILASIEVEHNDDWPPELNSFIDPSAMRLNKNVFEISAPGVYTTPWVDLECLEGLEAKVGASELFTRFSLKLLIFIEYDATGSDGQPNRQILQVAYPLNAVNDPDQISTSIDNILYDVSYDQPTVFSSTQTIYSWNDVYINGDLSLDPNAPAGTEVRIIAANSIEVSPDVNIGPGITLETGLPFACGEPIPQTELSESYCQEKYKAKNLESEKMESFLANQEERPIETAKDFVVSNFRVFPNPSNEEFRITYNLTNDSEVEISVYDNQGRLVKMVMPSTFQSKGNHGITEYLQNEPDGMYHLILRVNGKPQSVKLVKSSQ